ncbi:MAG: hypothetical protein JWM55_389 [Acidimicrobiaceae bacterium]|nr:hypothetical protein [Acidimicrobiaceae bacterium]
MIMPWVSWLELDITVLILTEVDTSTVGYETLPTKNHGTTQVGQAERPF